MGLGSLRIPASFCSVVGFRTSPGRVTNDDLPNGAQYDLIMLKLILSDEWIINFIV